MTEQKNSISSTIVKKTIAKIISNKAIGEKVHRGDLRKKIGEIEPVWQAPEHFHQIQIHMHVFSMDYILPDVPDDRQVLLMLHGGGYIAGMRNAYRSMAVLYSRLNHGMPVLIPDYRVAPEHPFPAALLDAYHAYEWLLRRGWEPDQIVIAGDSAGGGLALSLMHLLKKKEMALPSGVIAMSPWTDMTASGSSYEENYHKDLLFGNTEESMLTNRDYVQEHDEKDPYVSPLFGDFSDFPPMLIQAGGDEMLLSDAVSVAQKARRQGVQVRSTVYDGMFHVFQLALLKLPESRQAWDEVQKFLGILRRRNQK